MRVRRTVSTPSVPPARGFPRGAWWTLFLAAFMFVVPATSPWWSTVLRRELPDSAEEDGEGPTAATSAGADPDPSVVPGSTLKVVLHTRIPGTPGLGRAEREIPYLRGVVPQIKAVVSELAVGSEDAPALLPEGTQVLDVAYAQSGTVYVDFSPELELGRGVGAEEERVLVQGIVTTITDNFSAIRGVVILVDGRAPKPGHLDLTRALRRDDPSFVAEGEESSSPADSGEIGPPQKAPPRIATPSQAAPRVEPTLPPAKPPATLSRL